MQKWLDDNDILIDSNHTEFKSVITGRFIRTLKGKIYNKMTANDSKCYLDYLNNFVDEHNNIITVLFVKNLFILVILL